MILTFNKRAFAALLAVTALEALIATLGAPYPFLRGFVGDVVAVGWAYLMYRSFIRAEVLTLALAALFTSYAVELGQYLARQFGWRLEQPLLRVILGSVPDWWDMLAYTVGFALVLALAAWNRRGAALRGA
ncbi:ribosomal maturation YjgA family protein [Achromobacter insolitus]|uniref:ribosomal maturation YjgA family protein n=1 Tax=Achromobacter insolitus TaxID=217204 RepID=UPI00366FB251